MSRCFPYPPPGYTLSRSEEAALIKSIKLQREREKRNKDKRKERKKEQKDKGLRRHAKEKLLWSDSKSTLVDEAQVKGLESSSLSEEHGKPVVLLVPSSSVDSTDNSNSKKRSLSLTPGDAIRILQPCLSAGSTRERFPNHDLRYSSEDQSCTSLGIDEAARAVANAAKTGTVRPNPDPTPRKRDKSHTKFTDLMESWRPPSQLHLIHSDDMDWLFKSNDQEFVTSQVEKRRKLTTDALPCSNSSSLSWPQARYLPDVAVYALPYAVPF